MICTPIDVIDIVSGASKKTFGLWDTGATSSMITNAVARQLNLTPLGKRQVMGVHTSKLVDTYAIKLRLNNTNVVFNIIVAECDSLGPDGTIDMLIGMDVITKGDFSITNFQGNTVMSFRMPSIQKIDFVEGINQHHPIVTDKPPLRNQHCLCGSGKKYKHCCGKGKQ